MNTDLGGYHPSPPEVAAQATNIINQHASELSGRIGVNSASYVVNAVFHQIVAGKNYWVHFSTHDGHKFTVKIFVGLDGTVEISDPQRDHIQAPNH